MSEMSVIDRKKRVRRLKKLIIYGVLTAIFLPLLLCGYLAVRVISLKGQVAELSRELSAYTEQAQISETDAGTEPAEKEAFLTEEDSIRAWENQEKEQTAEKPANSGIRKVYLTFDDGPSMYTDEILDILKEYHVKATFFVVGEGKSAYRDMYRRIAEEGHTLGMHSYSHVYQEIYRSKEAFVKDVNELQDYLYELTDTYPEVYRFPGGSSNRAGSVDMQELKAYLDELGISWYDWNVSSGDATGRLSKEQIVSNCVSNLENYHTAVILMHDAADKKTTVEALPEIIETILAMEDTVLVPITPDTVPIQHKSTNP